MKIELENVKPAEIEKRSFEIITEELGDTHLIPGTEPIVKRCIHTSADFDYAKNLMFSEGAVEKALDAIRNGAVIVTDTQMGKAGINKRKLAEYGGEVLCFMSDEDVAETAKKNGTTRAVASMEKAAAFSCPGITHMPVSLRAGKIPVLIMIPDMHIHHIPVIGTDHSQIVKLPEIIHHTPFIASTQPALFWIFQLAFY